MADDIEPLILYVDPGSAGPEELAELFLALGGLYRALGGGGLSFTPLGGCVVAVTPVAGPDGRGPDAACATATRAAIDTIAASGGPPA